MINKQIVTEAHTQISGIVMLLIITVPPDGECGTKNIDRTNKYFWLRHSNTGRLEICKEACFYSLRHQTDFYFNKIGNAYNMPVFVLKYIF